MGRSSARPEALQAFANRANAINTDLDSWRLKLVGNYYGFLTSCSYGRVKSPAVEAALPALVTRFGRISQFVDLVRIAFEVADSDGFAGGVASLPDATLQAAFEYVARSNGLDPAS